MQTSRFVELLASIFTLKSGSNNPEMLVESQLNPFMKFLKLFPFYSRLCLSVDLFVFVLNV